jgi:hypothetical protein
MEWTVVVLTEALVHIVHLRCLASNSCQNDRLGDRFAVTRCGLKTIVPGARATTAVHPVPKRCCRFAAWPKPPNAEHACKTRTRPRCLRCWLDGDARRSGASFCTAWATQYADSDATAQALDNVLAERSVHPTSGVIWDAAIYTVRDSFATIIATSSSYASPAIALR